MTIQTRVVPGLDLPVIVLAVIARNGHETSSEEVVVLLPPGLDPRTVEHIVTTARRVIEDRQALEGGP